MSEKDFSKQEFLEVIIVKIKFVIERDELDGWYSYHMVIGKKAVTFIPVYDKGTYRLKLAGREELSRLERSREFAALARSLGLTKKQLISLMGYASSFKHWEQEREIEVELE